MTNTYSFTTSGDRKIELKGLKLDKDIGGYFLSATYLIEDLDSIRELYVPNIRLPIWVKDTVINLRAEPMGYFFAESTIDMGFGELPLGKIKDTSCRKPVFFKETVIKEKTKEMTLEEIEKKLGHKVKIVNK